MLKWLLVMVGGCLGAACRYGTALLAVKLWGTRFPWGTLIVNMTGCLLIGLAFGLAENRSWVSPSVRLFFVTGFLGALTTFSTFAWETASAAQSGAVLLAVGNFIVQNAGGLLCVLMGMWLGRSA